VPCASVVCRLARPVPQVVALQCDHRQPPLVAVRPDAALLAVRPRPLCVCAVAECIGIIVARLAPPVHTDMRLLHAAAVACSRRDRYH
jgi:hypothetical protein